MAAAGRDDERTLGTLLAANVGEIDVVVVDLAVDLVYPGSRRLQRQGAVEHPDRVGQGVNGVNGYFLDDGGFAGIGGGDHQTRDGALRGGHRHRQRALHRTHTAVECQFADESKIAQLLRQDLPRGDEQTKRNGEVETARCFGKVGGSEIDDSSPGVALVAEIGEGAFDPVNALADRHLRQADEDGLGKARSGIDLGLDRDGVDAHEGERV